MSRSGVQIPPSAPVKLRPPGLYPEALLLNRCRIVAEAYPGNCFLHYIMLFIPTQNHMLSLSSIAQWWRGHLSQERSDCHASGPEHVYSPVPRGAHGLFYFKRIDLFGQRSISSFAGCVDVIMGSGCLDDGRSIPGDLLPGVEHPDVRKSPLPALHCC